MTSNEWKEDFETRLKRLESEKSRVYETEFWRLLIDWVVTRAKINQAVCQTRDLKDQQAVASVSRAQGVVQFVEDFLTVQRRILKKGSAKS